jgi:hypothetical protein
MSNNSNNKNNNNKTNKLIRGYIKSPPDKYVFYDKYLPEDLKDAFKKPIGLYDPFGENINPLTGEPYKNVWSNESTTYNGGNASGSIKIYNHGVKLVRGSNRPYVSKINPNKFGSFDDFAVSGSLDQTGSYLAPCITTIALYDNELNMVAVAKLPKPIKSLPDYPVNFIVRFDT